MNQPLVIIQARTGSTRLPNKMLKPFYKDKCILEILLDRIIPAIPGGKANLVVATTTAAGDDRICELCQRLEVKHFRGSENDVLDRFVQAAKTNGANKIIRICADNVFLDTKSLAGLIDRFSASDCDYVSFKNSQGTPSIKTHYGFWAEAVTLEALEKVASTTTDKMSHEHVTYYIHSIAPQDFKIELIPISDTIEGIEEHPCLRLTVDTEDDFTIQQEIYSHLVDNGIEINPENIIAFLQSRNDLYEIMAKNIKANSK